jgi:hypothetical protein
MSYPFPKQNKMVLIDKKLTTRSAERSKSMYESYTDKIISIIETNPGNTGVFCISYALIDKLKKNHLIERLEKSGKIVYSEEKGLKSSENDKIVEKFFQETKNNGGVLLGVLGGRNSEGKDFSGDKMSCVIIAGLGFAPPKPSIKAQMRYYDFKFPAKGNAFGYIIPAIDKANQACGRPIRKETDKGALILLDNRYIQYSELLSKWISEDVKIIQDDENSIRDIRNFFNLKIVSKSSEQKAVKQKPISTKLKPKFQFIYILKLEHDKYYVGGTDNLKKRLNRLRRGGGSPWTQMHKMIDVENVIEGGDLKTITLDYMRKYGWENVRGYAWSQWNMKNPPKILRNK